MSIIFLGNIVYTCDHIFKRLQVYVVYTCCCLAVVCVLFLLLWCMKDAFALAFFRASFILSFRIGLLTEY